MVKLKSFLSSPLFLSLTVFLLPFTLYCLTLPTTNVGFGDSDMLIAVSYFRGVAHPPGYPLFVTLTYLTTHLPLPLTIATKAHLLSAILSSTTLVILFWAVRIILPPKLHHSNHLAFLSIMSLAIMFPFWTFSVVAEKYALNLLLGSLLIFLSLTLVNTKNSPSLKIWFSYFFIFSLALTTHLTLWFLIPMVIAVLFFKRSTLSPKFLFPTVAASALGILIPLVLLWVYNLNPNPPVSWHFPQTPNSLVYHATMQAFLPLPHKPVSGDQIARLTPKTPVFSQRFKAFFPYFKYLSLSYGLVPLTLCLFGLINLLIKKSPLHPPLRFTLLVGVLSTLILIPFLLPWPTTIAFQATASRQYILSYLFLPPLLSFGLIKLKRFSFLIPLLALILIARLFWLFPQVNFRHDTLFAQSYQHTLNSLPPNSLITCMSDVACFALMYEQAINHLRPDVIVIPEAYQFVTEKLNQISNLKLFTYDLNPFVALDYLSFNQDKRPIFVIDLQPQYYDLLGINQSVFSLKPYNGYAGLVTATPSGTLDTPDYTYSQSLLSTHYPAYDLYRTQRLAGTAQKHLVNAMAAKSTNDLDTFTREAQWVRQLSTRLPVNYMQANLNSLTNFQPIPYPFSPTPTNLISLSQKYLQLNDLNHGFHAAFAATLLAPTSSAARTALSQVYQLMGETALANIEAAHAQKLK